MMFYHDSTGIDPTGGGSGELIPSGQWLPFQILDAEDRKTKTQRDMLNLKCEVVEDPRWKGKWVWHTVVFIPKGEKGDGMSVHFRKCIGVAFGSNDLVDGISWVGKRFMGKVIIDEYNGKKNNKIAEVSPYGEKTAPPPEPVGAKIEETAEDEIPF